MRFFILAICFIPYSLTAQIKVSLGVGYGTYAMDDMKKFQESIAAGLPVALKTTSSFPGFVNFEGAASLDVSETNFFGLVVGFGSSGGRSSYSDYTGSMQVDQLAYYISLNATIGFKKTFASSHTELFLDLRPGFTFTNMELNINTTVGASSDKSQGTFDSRNFVAQPTVGLSKELKSFSVFMTAGYNFAIDLGTMTEHYNGNSNQTTLKADWSGIRLGIGASVYLRSKKKSLDQDK